MTSMHCSGGGDKDGWAEMGVVGGWQQEKSAVNSTSNSERLSKCYPNAESHEKYSEAVTVSEPTVFALWCYKTTNR